MAKPDPALLISLRPKSSDSAESEPEEMDDSAEDFRAMAREILDAQKADDDQAFADSLRAFVEACRATED